MIMATVRVILTSGGPGGNPDLPWLNLWSSIEASTAVIVCNLPIFNFLLRKPPQNKNTRPCKALTLPSHVGKENQLPEAGLYRGVQMRITAALTRLLPTRENSPSESILAGKSNQSIESDTVVSDEYELGGKKGSTRTPSRGESIV